MRPRPGVLLLSTIALALVPLSARAQYDDWAHHGAFVLLTTPQGADLPATARVEDFPVLVRLNRETFDFDQARSDGADIRFSAAGVPLAYEIERWDASQGQAWIWVRVPLIVGDSRQELALHWGNPDAIAASDGAAVFDASNGFVVVMHLGEEAGDPRDQVGSVSPEDKGTSPCDGAIGLARRFDVGRGIACGEQLTTLPTGVGPFTTSTWLRARRVNGAAIGWGNEQARGKAVLQVRSPPHLRVDGYFSSGTVRGEHPLPMSEWVHVVQVVTEGESRLFLNGQPDGVTVDRGSALDIRRPARMWLGGWYGNYDFDGDLDEVRISNVERSADWVKLCYENQRPDQRLVGTLRPPGNEFTVSPVEATIDEGGHAIFTAQAGGADKVAWSLVSDDREIPLATDRFSYRFDAGRVGADSNSTLRFRAVYADGVKTVDVPIAIRNTIPEPVVSLEAPATWDGREAIEVIPRLENLATLQAADADRTNYRWEVSAGAVIKEIAPDRLILKRSQFSGSLRITLHVDNGGPEGTATAEIAVTEPNDDPWIERIPDDDERPEEGQFYARDDRNRGTLFYRGSLDGDADAVFLRVFADDRPYRAETQRLAADRRYAFAIDLEPGLIRYRIEFGRRIGEQEEVLDRVGDLVCGDAFLIDGQSNALATDTHEQAPAETSEWIRSYGGPTGRSDGDAWVSERMNRAQAAGLARPNLWCRPVWKRTEAGETAEIGWWGMKLAERLVREHEVPICIIQAAVGGSRIDEHLPSPGDRTALATMYGRMLWRLRQARLTHGIRAVIWHQGENDQGADGPTGRYGWETYASFFVDLSAAWKEDLPNLRHYYLFQIWPDACAMGGRAGSGDRLREVQRTLPRLFSRMQVLSTLGIRPPGGCHYPLEGWQEFARLLQPMIERDRYGIEPTRSISPPDLLRARFSTDERTEIALEFDQPVVWRPELTREFYLDDESGKVVSGEATGNVVTLRLASPSAASRITYLKERDWSQDRLLWGANGLAALTFCDVPIAARGDTR